MDVLLEFFAVFGGLLLRFGIPIAATAGVAWILTLLDRRWQAEGKLLRVSGNSMGAAWNEVRCWEASDCPSEKREQCAAYLRPQEPCWQVFRHSNNRLKSECLTCQVFLDAPVHLAA